MKTNENYAWITEVHLITDPDFMEQYMALEMSAIAAMEVLKDILGKLIRDFPEDKIVHLSDLEELNDDNDDE